MRRFRSFRGVARAACVAAILAAGVAVSDDYKPWALRDHYSFKGEYSTFMFDNQTAEWMVDVTGLGILIKDAQCEIEYADGRTLRLSSLKAVRDGRENFDGPMGKGTRFSSFFITPENLEVNVSVARMEEHPALIVHITMTNLGDKPVSIKEVRPVVFDRGTVADLGAATVLTQANMHRQGHFSVMNDGASAGLVMFEVAKPRMTLGVGLLQSGLMNSSIDLKADGKSWVGAAHCRYEPALAIQPKTKVGSDPVWMSLFVPDKAQVSQFHAWAELQGMQAGPGAAAPAGWVTIARTAPAEELYKVAEAWADHSIHHVLVPGSWPSKPGSLEGRSPDYPQDMGKVADQLKSMGMKPGITFDPLATDETKEGWTIAAADGSRWLDLSKPQAREAVKKATGKLIGMGYDFFVVGATSMPDDVLQKMNVTRAQANLFAFQSLGEAAGGRPVVPAPSLTLGPELAKWREAVQAMAPFAEYGVASGPLQMETEGISSVSGDLAAQIKAYSGPLEITGTPKKDVRTAVGNACCLEAPPAKAAKAGKNN